MELGLSLGDTPAPFQFLDKTQKILTGTDLGFCMAAVGKVCENNGRIEETGGLSENHQRRTSSSDPPPVQPLDLLHFSPVHHKSQPSSSFKLPFPWLTKNLVNRRVEEGTTLLMSSPNSSTVSSSSFHQKADFSIFASWRKRDFEGMTLTANNEDEAADRGTTTCSRGSDHHDDNEEENNGIISRKKLRLTRQQSAFLEDNFKEHTALNPKQKVALAKQLNLRPRQVEVWFQNRRARTKLKQTGVDCEYLKRWCETLTEENRKLQKEVQELRALNKASSKPFYMDHLPPTTLTMCPSCERAAATATAAAAAAAAPPASTIGTTKLLSLETTANSHAQQAAVS